jgi:tetratricopeptide (TPR) repeat protein
VAAAPDFFEAWAELAYLQEQRGHWQSAEQAYEKALALDPGNQEILLRMIVISLHLKDPGTALNLARQGPQGPGFLLTAAAMFMTEAFFKEAGAVLDLAEQVPGMPVEINFYHAALAFEYHRDFPRAISHLEHIPETSKYHDRALRMKSQIQFEYGDVAAAFQTITQAAEIYPEQQELWFARVQLLIYDDRLEEATEVMRDMHLRWPYDPEVAFRLASLLHTLDHREEAMTMMEAILQENPDHAEALNYVGYILADENRDLDRALQLVLKANKLAPDRIHITDSVAWAYYRLGMLDEAWEAISYAIELGGNDPIIWDHYAAIAVALGKKEEAEKGEARASALREQQEDGE